MREQIDPFSSHAPIQLFLLNHDSIVANDTLVNTFRQKKVDVTEISYIHSIWLRRRDLNHTTFGL